MKRFICALLVCVFALTFISCTDKKTEPDGESDGIYVEYNGTKIVMGGKADSILASLGKEKDKDDVGDCGGLGALVMYSYDSFDLYVLESKDKGNIIDQITFRDDMIETAEGVFIGMGATEAKVALRETYGEPAESGEKEVKYVKGSYAVIVGIEDGKVTELNYVTKN